MALRHDIFLEMASISSSPINTFPFVVFFLSSQNLNIQLGLIHCRRLIIFTFPVLVTLLVTCFGFDIKDFFFSWLFQVDGIFVAGKSYLEFSKGLSFQAKISTGSTPCKCILCANDCNRVLKIGGLNIMFIDA